jgi:hypothetical protein
MSIRRVVEGVQNQGTDEIVVYSLLVTPWGSSPTFTSLKIFENVLGVLTDVTAKFTSGTGAVNGDTIVLPAISGIYAGHTYLCRVEFSIGTNTLSVPFTIIGEN